MFSKKYYRQFFKLTVFTILATIFSACSTTESWFEEDEDEKVRKVIAFHPRAIAGATDPMNIVVQGKAANGQQVDIKLKKIPLITSKRFKKIEAEKKANGKYRLKMYLDQHAKIRWQADSVKHHGVPIVVMVDDKPFAWWQVVEMARAQELIVVDCNLSKEMAEDIAAASENNYRKLNNKKWLD